MYWEHQGLKTISQNDKITGSFVRDCWFTTYLIKKLTCVWPQSRLMEWEDSLRWDATMDPDNQNKWLLLLQRVFVHKITESSSFIV